MQMFCKCFIFHVTTVWGKAAAVCLHSRAIFNVFVNAFIVNLSQSDIGCHILIMYYGCLLYADDIVLVHHQFRRTSQQAVAIVYATRSKCVD